MNEVRVDLPLTIIALHVALTLAGGLAVLMLDRRAGRLRCAPPGNARTLAALGVAGVVAVVSAIGATAWGVDFFGIIHLWFADLLIAAPVLGLAQTVVAGRTRGFPLVVGLLLIAGGGAAAWGHFAEPFRLQLETPTVITGKLRRSLTIGILTDLQTAEVTAYEEEAVSRLMAAKPDLIVVPGDVFQGSDQAFEGELPRLRALLSRLAAPLGVFAVIGNTDHPRQFERILEGTSITWLHNQITEVESDFGTVVIAGVGYAYTPEVQATYREIATHTGPGILALVIAHDPGVLWRRGIDHGADLVLAGHTHGGQVRLPFIGSLLTLSRLPRKYAAGLHPWQGSWLYVSRGVGVERAQAPRIRFLCPPEITLLTVTPEGVPARAAP